MDKPPLALLFTCDECGDLEHKLEGNYLAVTEGPPGELRTVFYCMVCAFQLYGDKKTFREIGAEILRKQEEEEE